MYQAAISVEHTHVVATDVVELESLDVLTRVAGAGGDHDRRAGRIYPAALWELVVLIGHIHLLGVEIYGCLVVGIHLPCLIVCPCIVIHLSRHKGRLS